MKLLSNGNCSARDWQRMLWRRMLANTVIQVVVIDEIGNAKEVAAVKDIAQRGVKMVATVHGTTLQHMLENPALNPLWAASRKWSLETWQQGKSLKLSLACCLFAFYRRCC